MKAGTGKVICAGGGTVENWFMNSAVTGGLTHGIAAGKSLNLVGPNL